jgi:hypothetical protein
MDGLPRKPYSYIYEPLWVRQMTKLPLALKLKIQTPQGQIGHVILVFNARPRLRRSPHPPDASPAILPRVADIEASRHARIPSLPAEPPGLGFVAQLSNPMVLW